MKTPYKTGSKNVTLVNPNGEITGEEDVFEAHSHPAKLHLAPSVFLFNSKNQLLIQKRSEKKIVGAGWWANTVCGNVDPKESVEDCAFRRLKQELGINRDEISNWRKVTTFQYKAYCNTEFGEHELDTIFFGTFNGIPQLNPEEVSEYIWIDWKQLINLLHKQSQAIQQVLRH